LEVAAKATENEEDADTEERLHRARWEHFVRERLGQLADQHQGERFSLGLETLMSGERRGVVAHKKNVHPHIVYNTKVKVKEMLSNDPMIQRLHKER